MIEILYIIAAIASIVALYLADKAKLVQIYRKVCNSVAKFVKKLRRKMLPPKGPDAEEFPDYPHRGGDDK
jgi:hypothetical protein